MTWPHAWSGARRVPLQPEQVQPFRFPDLEGREREYRLILKNRQSLGSRHDAQLHELRLARLRYEASDGAEAFAGYREALEAADRRLMAQVARAILDARLTQWSSTDPSPADATLWKGPAVAGRAFTDGCMGVAP